ncbi:amidase family protein [Spirochaeta africana]|uniref:Glutamyl-tRNA(Gln) amidotransferase subunit A n=1 Tax=Spirochaeta africana (strain ATCC 700263 / DSM 8902 / Z-7692) TaxID=889378 RepID=H9UMY3_SPIAZ|nr:amidase family protein [Spirochaeta africana]AFG38876.1 amidase, Asp-tRNAAsn/Glu-tRNAGln amidotransferase A subunit [Spirochaeta africana DSM 8902]
MHTAADTATTWRTALKTRASREGYFAGIQDADAGIGAFLSWNTRMPEATAGGSSNGSPALVGAEPDSADPARGAGTLAGLPFGVKDNIAVQGQPLSCGSRMLAGLQSPYSGTAVERLLSAGAVVVGKTNMDEFGMGSATENSALGETVNPWDSQRVAGGSSGGSAAAVAAGLVPFALGSDTGGSVRQPAGFCGVYGLKPTYGAVSRYGLVAYASSLEVIGVFTRDLELMRTVFSVIRGSDGRDQTTIDWEAVAAELKPAPRRLAFIAGDAGLQPDVARTYGQMRERARDCGYEIQEIDLATLAYAVPAYYTIATAEASANLARYNGVRYGHRPVFAESPVELMRKSRTEGFGDEVKLRIMLGTYVLRSGFQDQFYVRAQRIRTKLYQELASLFSGAQGLVLPVFPSPPFKRGGVELDAFQQKQGDRFTTLANLSGCPACAFPAGTVDGLPIGMQIMGPHGSDERLLDIIAELRDGEPVVRPPSFYTIPGTEVG